MYELNDSLMASVKQNLKDYCGAVFDTNTIIIIKNSIK